MKIRELTTGDLFLIVDMLKKVGASAGSRLNSLFVSGHGDSPKADDDPSTAATVGIMVLTELYESLRDDYISWCASLVDLTVDQYLLTPPETTIDIMEQLVDSKAARGFFSRAYQLYKTIARFRRPTIAE